MKGLQIKEGVGPAEWMDYSGITEEKEPEQEQIEVLRDLLDYIGESGKEALFIVSPYVMESVETRMQFNYLERVITEAGYPVLDFNRHIEEIGIDFSEDFYDYGSHVNALGEVKCTEFLKKYLTDNYDLPDRRGVKGYESWDEAWELYQRKQAEAEARCREDIANENWAPEVAE